MKIDWHTRYLQQARWTESLRTFIFGKIGLSEASRVFEVGCGTGAVLADIPLQTGLFGLDIDLPGLLKAGNYAHRTSLVCGDGVSLPFPGAVFDIVFCHFLLLWVTDPLRIISEMRRVTRSGGAIVALAEPDYGGRIDYPLPLIDLGHLQTMSLRRQGADPEIGRKLSGIFNNAGLNQVQTGVLGGEWGRGFAEEEYELEWKVIIEDLAGSNRDQELAELKEMDRESQQNGERVLFVPTFYAWGTV